MLVSINEVTFGHPTKEQFELIYHWFEKPHISAYYGDPEAGRPLFDLRLYLAGKEHFWTPWLAYHQEVPFAYLMTARVRKNEAAIWAAWREKDGKTYSLDMVIGEEAFLGQGISHLLVTKFINEKFAHVDAFLIDVELRNLHAIHVFEKAGFVIVDEFKGEHDQFVGIPHVMMKLKLAKK